MKIIQSCFFGLSKLGMMKWSLKMIRSALAESFLLVLMTQVDTGHCSLRNTPRPGLMPQPLAPVQKRTFLRGSSEESWLSGVPGGMKFICEGILSWPGACSGYRDIDTLEGPGLISPPAMYHGLDCGVSAATSTGFGSGLVTTWMESKIIYQKKQDESII